MSPAAFASLLLAVRPFGVTAPDISSEDPKEARE